MSSDRSNLRAGTSFHIDQRQVIFAKIVTPVVVLALVFGFAFREQTAATVSSVELESGVIGAPVAGDHGVAINGYDPVAYFTDGEALEGSQNYAADWRGAEWWFETEENRSTFLSAPSRFAPQFGGYALEGVANGSTLSGDPKVFKIRDGRLYLSRSAKSQSLWLRNPDGYIRAAEAVWAASCPVEATKPPRVAKANGVIPYC